MNKISGGAFALAASLVLLAIGSSACAQSFDQGAGFLGTLKGIVSNPQVKSYLLSKVAGPNNLQPAYQDPSLNPYHGASPNTGGFAAAQNGFLPQPGLPYSDSSPKSLLLNTLKNAVLSKVNPLAVPDLNTSYLPPANSYSAPANLLAPPASGFYSLEEGTALGGGIGYANQGAIQPFTSSNPGTMTISKQLQPAELQLLGRYDINVLIDKSSSMTSKDCSDPFLPGRTVSRWQWCKDQTTMLSQETANGLSSGISVVPFSNKWTRFDNVSPQAINAIFQRDYPQGSTDLAAALRAQLDQYFQERKLGIRKRPQMIAIITDGVPDSRNLVYQVVRQAAQKMQNPNEIRIVFFLIGQDQKGLDFVSELESKLSYDGFPNSIVRAHSFAEVNQLGLPRSLAYSLN